MKFRSVGVLAGTATLALTATACGGNDDGTEAPAGMVVWASEERVDVLEPFAAEFGEANGVGVDLQALPNDELQANFVTAHEAGSGPDVLIGAHDWIGNLVQNNAVDPVQLPGETIDDLDETALEAASYEGQVYGFPYATESLMLVRNTELAPDAPESIEELVETGSALKEEGDTAEILSVMVGQNGDPYHLHPLYTSGGGYLFGQDEHGDHDPTDLGVGTPESIEAMERIAELGEEGEGALKRSVGNQNALALFADGDAPYFITGPWDLNEIRKSGIDYDISPVPGFEGAEEARPFLGAQVCYVASGGENKVLAEEFVTNHMTDPDVAAAFYDAEPLPPSLGSAHDQVEDPDLAKMAEAGENAEPMPAIPQMASVWDPMGKAQASIIGGADPENALRAAEKTIANEIG
ncbi:sugar ABC transporter substrate-binding protein [Allosalinactinospora lopnorensis]|uniref:sugar ABC transporter substrate-binding protein n=1 Tax=Allosalinactinospora lopnorensis TaxID=1352348 RepID=UPI000623E5DD|nr:maltose ABC transporter substrate-binding protein [Allosalinactinospora lopnorensis]